MDYTGVKESGGIDKQPKPSKSQPFQGMNEENITPPTSSTPKGTPTAPNWPKVTKDEGG